MRGRGGAAWSRMVAAVRARRPRIDAAAGLRTARELRDALSASERLLRQTLEGTRTGSWSWDVRANVIQWSDNLGPIHGLPRGAQPESFQELLELLHPDDRQRLVDAVEACVQEGRGYEIELRTAPRDGDVRWIWASASAMDLEDGRPRRIVGLTRDITTRKRAETAAAHADSLQQVTAGLSAAATVGEIADVVIDQGIPALSASTGILGVVEPPDGLRFVRSVGYGDVFPDRLRLSDPWPITDAIRQRRVIELRDVPDRRAVYDVPERVWEASGKGALVAVPLVVRDRVVGALGFTRDDAAALTADERGLVEALAGQAAQALERASLAEADRRARVRAEALQRVASAIATAVSVEDVADAVAEEALELHDASGVTVILVRPDDPATARVLASRGMVAAHATSEPTVDLGLGTLTAASIGSATALYAESVEQLEAEWPASARVARALGVGAVACVPFRVGERAGALSVVLAEPRPVRARGADVPRAPRDGVPAGARAGLALRGGADRANARGQPPRALVGPLGRSLAGGRRARVPRPRPRPRQRRHRRADARRRGEPDARPCRDRRERQHPRPLASLRARGRCIRDRHGVPAPGARRGGDA